MKIYLIACDKELVNALKSDLEKLGSLTCIKGCKMPEKDVIAKAVDAEILVCGPAGVEKISEKMLQGMKKLKMISALSVRTHWIDIETAKERGIKVCNIKGANSESVAEHAWGMILDLSKRISEFDRGVRYNGAYRFDEYKGKEVYGKTIGIIGLGDIGKKVARIAKGFDMKVLGCNKSGKPVSGVKLVSLETLLKESDIIVTCVPTTKETTNMISEKEIRLMKPGVILVNPADEPITDKKAVLKAVESGKIFGFGIETEIMTPVPKDDMYLKHARVVITPHNAFNTEEADKKSNELAIENIRAFLKGKPQNVVV